MLHYHCHQHHYLLFQNHHVPMSPTHHYFSLLHPSPSPLLHRPITFHLVSAIPPATSPWITHIAQLPIEIPFPTPSMLATTEDTATIQVASSVLLTGAITASLFRSIRRRAKRAKELKFRSSAMNKSLDSMKATRSPSIKAKNRPTPDQALLGAIIAGVMAVILYNFIKTVEAAFSLQPISDNFSIRQVTITVRTIFMDACYLATFIYGFSSIGLLLYSGQLATNGFKGGSTGKEKQNKITEQSSLSNSSVESLTDNNKFSSTKEDQSSNHSQ